MRRTPRPRAPADDEPFAYTEAQLDGSCRYGKQLPPFSRRDLHGERASATGLHTFDHNPDQTLLEPGQPIALRLAPRYGPSSRKA